MTPLTILWLQPISYLSRIGINTIPNQLFQTNNTEHLCATQKISLHVRYWNKCSLLGGDGAVSINGEDCVRKWCFLGCTCGHLGNIFGVEYLILATKTKDAREKSIFQGVCVAILGHWWGPWWLGKVDMPIPVRYEIGWSQKVVSGVIFGVEYLILATNTKIPGRMMLFGVYVWPFWGSDGAPNGRGW